MPRKRMIDPSIWCDDGFAELTTRQQVLFIGLFSNADDDGRLKASPTALRLMLPAVYGLVNEAELREDLDAVLGSMTRLARYQVGGREYLYFSNYAKWQKIDHPQPSQLPGPEDHDARALPSIEGDSPNDRGTFGECSGNVPAKPVLIEVSLIESKLVEEKVSNAAPAASAPTAHAADAALVGPEPAAAPPVVNSAPKPKGRNLRPLFDAFQALGLKMPPITKQAGPAASDLLRNYSADQVARAWQDVLTLEWGDDWLLKNLSFESLNARNRMGNWERERDTPAPDVEEVPRGAPRPPRASKLELPPEEQSLANTWQAALDRIKDETRAEDFRAWFSGSRLVIVGASYVIEAEEHQIGWLLKSRRKVADALGVDQELIEFRARPVPVGASP